MLFRAEKMPIRRALRFSPILFLGASNIGIGSVYAQITSSNWSGYIATTSSNFTSVSTTFVIPTLTAPSSGTSYSSYWVGVDGYNNTDLEQCGIEANISAGQTSATYTAWYEFIPAPETPVSLTVHAGDTIFDEVEYEPSLSSAGNYAYLFDIDDETTGKSFDQTEFTTSNDPRSSAEWIGEATALEEGTTVIVQTLANFGSVTFSNSTAVVNGGNSQSVESLGPYSITMHQVVQQNTVTVALPSNIDSDGQTFTDYYDSTLPGLIWTNSSGNHTWNLTSKNWSGLSNSPGAYGDGTSVTFNDSNGGSGNYSVTLSNTVLPAAVIVNNSSGNYTISGSGAITGNPSLTKTGGDKLIVDTSNSALGAVSIGGGGIQLGASTGLATMTSLAISGGGTFDVNNNHIIINYSGESDPIASIAALLKTGYDGGAWNGAGGIISAAAAANSASYGLGYADSADSGNPAGLPAGEIEVKYTLLGDANLSGVVDGTDFGIVAANFNKGVSRWDQGDFNYDGTVDGTDFGDLAANFNKGASGAAAVAALDEFAAANGLLAEVPEPASMALVGLVAGGVLMRRSQRHRQQT